MFRFRFETLMRVRRLKEQMALQAYAESQRKYVSLVNRRQKYLDEVHYLAVRLEDGLNKGISGRDLKTISVYNAWLDRRLKDLDRDIAVASKDVEKKRSVLIKARKDHKAIQRLKEIELERYSEEERRAEMRFIDEIAVISDRRTVNG